MSFRRESELDREVEDEEEEEEEDDDEEVDALDAVRVLTAEGHVSIVA